MMSSVAEPVVNVECKTIDAIDNDDKDIGCLRVDEVTGYNTDVVFTRSVVPAKEKY